MMVAVRVLLLSVLWALLFAGCGQTESFSAAPPPETVALRGGQAAGQATVSGSLNTGWNAFALQYPRLNSLSAASSVLGCAYWNGTDYVAGPFTAEQLNSGGVTRGYWVFSTASSTFSYTADADADNTVRLAAGWNFVAFASPGEISASSLVARRGSSEVALGSVVLTQFLEVGPTNGLTTVDVALSGARLKPGRPYWVYAVEPVTLTFQAGPAPSPSPSPPGLPSPFPPASPSPFPPAVSPLPSPSVGASPPNLNAGGFSMQSEPGDYVGQGKTWTYHNFNALFTATPIGSNGTGVTVRIQGSTWWTADFAAPKGPSGNARLVPGVYSAARRYPFHGPLEPGLAISGDGRGNNELFGEFVVYECVFDSAVRKVLRFSADFVQYGEKDSAIGPALRGQVRFAVP